jgi:hypothetical protein
MVLDFNLMLLTPYHFLKAIFSSGAIFSNTKSRKVSQKVVRQVREYAFYYLDAVTEDYHIISKFSDSIIAASCLYLAR